MTELLVTLIDCNDYDDLDAVNFIYNSIAKYNLTLVTHAIHNFNPAFTFLVILAESHISLHTYPEYKNIYINLFLCTNKGLEVAKLIASDAIDRFKPKEIKIIEAERE